MMNTLTNTMSFAGQGFYDSGISFHPVKLDCLTREMETRFGPLEGKNFRPVCGWKLTKNDEVQALVLLRVGVGRQARFLFHCGPCESLGDVAFGSDEFLHIPLPEVQEGLRTYLEWTGAVERSPIPQLSRYAETFINDSTAWHRPLPPTRCHCANRYHGG